MMNINHVINFPFEDVIQTYGTKDALFYALSIGLGSDPLNDTELRYVYEKDMVVMPAMVTILGRPGNWGADPKAGIDLTQVVYAEQYMELHQTLPAKATIRARERVAGVADKGEGKGALIYTERTIHNHDTNELLATLRATMMCRGNGGCGSIGDTQSSIVAIPSTPAEKIIELPTLPQQALIYRLNGDMNPLHADPKMAKRVGFDRPILHGLCSYGFAVHAVLNLWCDYDVSRIKSVNARFSAPMIPGETFVVETWLNDGVVAFRVLSKERNIVVLNNGTAVLSD